jgi:energy-coupling factor transport system ATP-binding protein
MSVEVKGLSFIYGAKTPYEKKAIDNVSFTINKGECVGIVGATGSGKSTLIQHFNGLIKLQSGELKVLNTSLNDKKPDLINLRKGIGMLFQYPEYQLFADTVLEDVMFGPINFGMSKSEAEESATKAIKLVGLDFESMKNRSPLEISGGQKRRVAIAGVLAYNPEILVLDEPTAGLDPAGKKEMLDLITKLRDSSVNTIIMVSHNMDEIAQYTDRVIVLKDASLCYDTTPGELFYNHDLESLGLDLPHVVKIVKSLKNKGIDLGNDILDVITLSDRLKKYLGGAL